MSVPNIQRRAYSNDLTLAQWGIVSPMLRPNTGRGRRNIHDLKDIADAVLYLDVNGCKWVGHRVVPLTERGYTSGAVAAVPGTVTG